MTCKMVRSNGGGSCGRRFVASPEDLPYIVWDSTVNNNDEYGPAPSLHSHPASIITYNHIPPMINSCQASSTLSWDSSTFSRRCCSPACCAILLTAILILAALLTVIGVAVYLGIITNLSKATILPVSGRFRVISGDDFVPTLYNTSSTSFLEKAEKYNAIIHSAFQWTSIDSSIVKSEVYAFRKGSLIVYFRIYLDRKKILQARNALSFGRIESRSSSTSPPPRNDNLIPHLVQHEMREGLVQLRMIGAGRPEIDLNSLTVTSYHTDPMLNLKDQTGPLHITRGNVFYERNDGDPPTDSVLTAIHLKPLKQSTRKPTLLQLATKSTQGSTSTTTTTTTTTTTPHPLISSKSNIKYQKPLINYNNIVHDDNGNQHNRRFSNDHPNDSLINRFAGRLRPSRPSLTTVRPVIVSATSASSKPTTTLSTTVTPATIRTTSTTPLTSTTTTKSTTTSTTTIMPPLFTTRKVRLTSTTTTTTTTTPEPPPIVYTDESIKLTSRDPNIFTRKTTRTRIDFPSLLAGLRSTTTTTTTTPVPEPISSTVSLGTVSPIPPNHKPPPGTSIKVTSLDFGQWRPLSPFKPPNQPKLPSKLIPSSPSAPSLSSSSSFSSQFTHMKPPQPPLQHSPSLNDYNPHSNNRLGYKPGQINKMPMVIAVSPGEHIRRRIPISVL